ncbi:glycosyltransferase family 4 protein [Candidatus Binatus sp.]|uniref:glycosyltransferase family 4 protein n=1 Tax=Candidatus Binatus sp. TaxID=2811406 RepID=UPI00272A9697|nr:glycosyltransferase family 4 protein [Candidatus Binatus sp.]
MALEANDDASRRLSIVGVDPEPGFSGGETQVLALTLALNAAGHRAELICDPAGRLFERALAAGIRCHPLRIRNAIDLAAAMRLRTILRREHFDVVHFHTSRAHSMAPFVRDCASATVVTRRMDYRPNRLFAPFLFNRSVDRVIAISAGVADSLEAAGVDRNRIATIHSGVDCDRFCPPSIMQRDQARSSLGLGRDEIAVVAIGSLEARKGHRYLLEAAASLARTASKHAPAIRYFIAGDGSIRREIENQIAQLGCPKGITMLGRIDDPLTLLWASDIFMMPSLKEGLGVAALEAMSCGLPTIASAVGGLAELVEHDRTGVQVEPAHSDQLASAIARLAASPELRTRMGAAARIRVEQNYSMAAMAARTLALYRACLNQPRGEKKV